MSEVIRPYSVYIDIYIYTYIDSFFGPNFGDFGNNAFKN
jgi:hypothetical protein